MADLNGGIVGVDNPAQVQAEQITTFNSSGTLTTGALTTSLDFLCVAGGAAGGNNTNANGCGGGGAGGYREISSQPVSASTGYPIVITNYEWDATNLQWNEV